MFTWTLLSLISLFFTTSQPKNTTRKTEQKVIIFQKRKLFVIFLWTVTLLLSVPLFSWLSFCVCAFQALVHKKASLQTCILVTMYNVQCTIHTCNICIQNFHSKLTFFSRDRLHATTSCSPYHPTFSNQRQ